MATAQALATLLAPFADQEDVTSGWRLAGVLPEAAARAASLLDAAMVTARPNWHQPPMWWLIDLATQFDGRLVGSLTRGHLRLDGIQVQGMALWRQLLERLERDWPTTADADALGTAVAEVWRSWDAEDPVAAGGVEDVLVEGLADGVYGLWWD